MKRNTTIKFPPSHDDSMKRIQNSSWKSAISMRNIKKNVKKPEKKIKRHVGDENKQLFLRDTIFRSPRALDNVFIHFGKRTNGSVTMNYDQFRMCFGIIGIIEDDFLTRRFYSLFDPQCKHHITFSDFILVVDKLTISDNIVEKWRISYCIMNPDYRYHLYLLNKCLSALSKHRASSCSVVGNNTFREPTELSDENLNTLADINEDGFQMVRLYKDSIRLGHHLVHREDFVEYVSGLVALRYSLAGIRIDMKYLQIVLTMAEITFDFVATDRTCRDLRMSFDDYVHAIQETTVFSALLGLTPEDLDRTSRTNKISTEAVETIDADGNLIVENRTVYNAYAPAILRLTRPIFMNESPLDASARLARIETLLNSSDLDELNIDYDKCLEAVKDKLKQSWAECLGNDLNQRRITEDTRSTWGSIFPSTEASTTTPCREEKSLSTIEILGSEHTSQSAPTDSGTSKHVTLADYNEVYDDDGRYCLEPSNIDKKLRSSSSDRFQEDVVNKAYMNTSALEEVISFNDLRDHNEYKFTEVAMKNCIIQTLLRDAILLESVRNEVDQGRNLHEYFQGENMCPTPPAKQATIDALKLYLQNSPVVEQKYGDSFGTEEFIDRFHGSLSLDSPLESQRDFIIFFGHKKWNMIVNMMTGIQYACKRASWEPMRDICLSDFRGPDIFPIRMTKRQTEYMEFFDYAPAVFRSIRRKFGFDDKTYLNSVGPDHLISNLILGNLHTMMASSSEGKSGAFFYKSHDGKFLIKTISHRHMETLIKVLPLYYDHIMRGPSYIVKFFGLHSMRWVSEKPTRTSRSYKLITFLVMENILCFHTPMTRIYDLKGSTAGRESISRNGSVAEAMTRSVAVYKDNDLFTLGDYINVGSVQKKRILEILERDTRLFVDAHILDYSLLIGFSDVQNQMPFKEWGHQILLSLDGSTRYHMGVIDFLTKWTFPKRAERIAKVFMCNNPHTISCVPPDEYRSRFLKFIGRVVI